MSSERGSAPSLQDGIDEAGSPIKLLWQPNAVAWTPEVVEREYAGWRQEQAAWHDGVTIADLSHHMSDTFVEGPDAMRLLTAVGANDFDSFEIGQAKQFIPVSVDGNIVSDGILMRTAESSYTLTGVSAGQSWLKYRAQVDGYDVSFSTDPSTAVRENGDPKLFRYQVQGPLALELVERAFGGPLPATRFFHSTQASLAGAPLRALRHGMPGQAGYEFIGGWEHAEAVKEALMRAGEPLGLVQIGALAYPTSALESGWIPRPVPAIYTSPELADYRKHLSLYSEEGQVPLHGSFYSDEIADYYCSPYELGYGRLISFNHDFIGREALEEAQGAVRRTKVTLVFDERDVRQVMGTDYGFVLSYARQRIEADSTLVGMTHYAGSVDPAGAILSLALVDQRYAAPGTEVTVVWGEHPGPGTAPDADLGHPHIRATVQPAPYDVYARTQYRRNP